MGEEKTARKRGGLKERAFSMDLRSSDAVNSVSLGDQRDNSVSIEGTIGILECAGFVDNSVLEVVGAKGVLRVDLAPKDLSDAISKDSGVVERIDSLRDTRRGRPA